MVGLFVSVEFVPPALVAYDGEGLQSFFVEDEAVIAVFVSRVFCQYYADVVIGRARWTVVEICRVNIHPFV